MALKIVEFFTGFTSETQPNLTSIEAERLGTYADDAAYVSAKGSAAAEGDAYGNTTDNTIHYYNGSAWVSIASIAYVDAAIDTDIATHAALTATHGVSGDIVGTSDSQTLTNKTLTSPDVNTPDIDGGTINDVDFDGGTASNTSRVTLPKAATATLEGLDRKEGTIFFDSTEKKFYGDDGTEVISLGGGAGGASIEVEQSTHGFDVLDAIYFDESDDTWYLAQANSVDTVATHIVVEDTDTDNFICASSGRWEITSHGAAEGYHFVSTTTAGATVTTEPTSGVSNPAFHAVTANYIDVYTGYRPNLIGDGVASDSEVGVIMSYAGTSVPTGFLECDGSAVSRSTYAELFSKIGVTWGSGDGSTTFNLPDGRSGFLVGAGTGTQFTVNTNRSVGDYNDDQLQDHEHEVKNNSSFGLEYQGATVTGGANGNVNADNPFNAAVDYFAKDISTGRSGTETVPNSLAVKFIIRYAPKGALMGEGFSLETNDDIGKIFDYAGASLPTGHKWCNGESLDTTTYSDLFNVIGYRFGGSGSSFTLPFDTNLKQYTLSVSGSNSWSTSYAVGVPYVTDGGVWRLRFNIKGTHTSAASTDLTVANVDFANDQAITQKSNVSNYAIAYVRTASSGLIDTRSGASSTDTAVSGDVALAGKPSFVDDNSGTDYNITKVIRYATKGAVTNGVYVPEVRDSQMWHSQSSRSSGFLTFSTQIATGGTTGELIEVTTSTGQVFTALEDCYVNASCSGQIASATYIGLRLYNDSDVVQQYIQQHASAANDFVCVSFSGFLPQGWYIKPLAADDLGATSETCFSMNATKKI